MDIIHEIETTVNNKAHYTHVYGHQDEKGKPLNIEEYFNTIVDNIANSNAQQPVQMHPPSQNAIYVNDKYIPYNYKQYLRQHVFSNQAKQFLQNKYKWTKETYNSIYWQAYAAIFNNLP